MKTIELTKSDLESILSNFLKEVHDDVNGLVGEATWKELQESISDAFINEMTYYNIKLEAPVENKIFFK